MRDVELRRYAEKAMIDCIKWPKLNHYRSLLTEQSDENRTIKVALLYQNFSMFSKGKYIFLTESYLKA